MTRAIKERFFVATVESVLLYGCESWSQTSTMEALLNGCYTRMLHAAFNISWQEHVTNEILYGSMPRVTEKIRSRRLQLAGHCYRHPELPAHHVLLWQPSHGNRQRGRPTTIYPRTLLHDSSAQNINELKTLLTSRQLWQSISGARPRPPE